MLTTPGMLLEYLIRPLYIVARISCVDFYVFFLIDLYAFP